MTGSGHGNLLPGGLGRAGAILLHPAVFRVLLVLTTLGIVTALGAGYVLERLERGLDVPDRAARLVPEPSTEKDPALKRRALSAYGVISGRDLFGTARAKRELEASKQEEVDVSAIPLAAQSLRLRLKGTVIGEDGVERVAVIEDQQTRKQGLYREGDRIRTALIKSILRNNVVINTGTRDEVLTIDPEHRGNGAGAAP